MVKFRVIIFGAIVVFGGLMVAHQSAKPVHAGFFTKILKEAGEAGGTAGRVGAGSLDNVARVIKDLPKKSGRTAIAAQATPEGHWIFVNRNGEKFTAANADELARFADNIAPDYATGTSKLELYLNEDTVFNRRAMLKDLPPDAQLFITSKRQTFAIGKTPETDTEVLYAKIRPNVVVKLNAQGAFQEALWQLDRRLNAADIRQLSLSPGGPGTLPGTPRFDKAKKAAMVDLVDPWKLETAFQSIRGQTAVVTGRVKGEKLYFKTTATGGERDIDVASLVSHAKYHEVNLVVLDANAVQPGGRNWFLQKVEIEGLDEAVRRATFADFLNALGVGRGQLEITAQAAASNRVSLQIVPTNIAAEPISGTVGDWVQTVVSEVTGNIFTNSINVYANSSDHQKELDRRLVSWLPSVYQYGYIMWFLMGVIGLGYARSWWHKVWPAEEREDYANSYGYWAAKIVRGIVFIFLFLPVVGIPAFFITILDQLLGLILLPFRAVGWMMGKLRGGT